MWLFGRKIIEPIIVDERLVVPLSRYNELSIEYRHLDARYIENKNTLDETRAHIERLKKQVKEMEEAHAKPD